MKDAFGRWIGRYTTTHDDLVVNKIGCPEIELVLDRLENLIDSLREEISSHAEAALDRRIEQEQE